MNTRTTSLLFIACSLLISGVSFASDKHHRSHSGISLGYSYSSGGHHGVQLGYSKHRNRHHDKHYSTPSHSYKSYSNHRNNRHYNYNYGHQNYSNHIYQKSCHPVTKSVVGYDGYSHIVAGTMCYDSYGQGYIVAGSRYHKR